MTTTRPRPAKRPAARKKAPPKGDVRAETLLAFDAQLCEHAGHAVGFAELVADLWVTRQSIKALTAARQEVFALIKTAHAHGTRQVGDWELRETKRTDPVVYRAVESAAVKRAAPAAWQAAQTLVRRVSVTAPATQPAPRVEVPRSLPKGASVELAIATYKSPLFDQLKRLKADEDELVERLDKLAAEFGWDGEEITFADGWKAGTRRRQFSGELLATIDPDTWERLAVTKVKETAPRVYLARAGEPDEAVDLDGE
jgi:hypothetical protein